MLREGFDRIGDQIEAAWAGGERLYLRNLFTWAPTPFFNRGLIVDADGSIHPSNVGLSASLEELLSETRVGHLDAPPTPSELRRAEARTNALLQERLPARVWASTHAADRELSRLCRRLYPAFLADRARRAA